MMARMTYGVSRTFVPSFGVTGDNAKQDVLIEEAKTNDSVRIEKAV